MPPLPRPGHLPILVSTDLAKYYAVGPCEGEFIAKFSKLGGPYVVGKFVAILNRMSLSCKNISLPWRCDCVESVP